ncbi:MAG: hypothetical protein ACM34H_09950, partial [Deltaproteobacteria bacterium]
MPLFTFAIGKAPGRDSDLLQQIRNPNLEIRNKHQIQNSKLNQFINAPLGADRLPAVLNLRALNLFRASRFGFRISSLIDLLENPVSPCRNELPGQSDTKLL